MILYRQNIVNSVKHILNIWAVEGNKTYKIQLVTKFSKRNEE
jgi:hypothetical protein